MTRFAHDQFAKNYLCEQLSPLGIVNPGREINSEVRQIDVYFTPTTNASDYSQKLGMLGKMATTAALFEPYRNPVGVSDVCSCLSKLLEIKAQWERQLKRDNPQTIEAEPPKLWILTPTASEAILSRFNPTTDEENWWRGIYFLGEHLRTAIVVYNLTASLHGASIHKKIYFVAKIPIPISR